MIYLELFLSFLKIGLFTIGGGYAMIPLISSTIVAEKGWITQELLIDFIAIAESTPGPFAVNIATFVGYQMGGVLGVLCTIGGIFLPSFVIIFLIFKLSKSAMKKPFVLDALGGMQATVVALIASAFVTIAITAFTFVDGATGASSFNWFSFILFILCFVAMRIFKKLHPIILIIASAALGILFYGFIL